jgi:hypothetical protein
VNRWPQRYAYTYATLGYPALPDARLHILGPPPRSPTSRSIDRAGRKVQDCLSRKHFKYSIY